MSRARSLARPSSYHLFFESRGAIDRLPHVAPSLIFRAVREEPRLIGAITNKWSRAPPFRQAPGLSIQAVANIQLHKQTVGRHGNGMPGPFNLWRFFSLPERLHPLAGHRGESHPEFRTHFMDSGQVDAVLFDFLIERAS
jgi:hypothetical protein